MPGRIRVGERNVGHRVANERAQQIPSVPFGDPHYQEIAPAVEVLRHLPIVPPVALEEDLFVAHG